MEGIDLFITKAQLAVLKDVAEVYGGKTIDNIIQQMEAIIKEAEK